MIDRQVSPPRRAFFVAKMNPQQPDLSALRQVMSQQGMNTGILDQNNPSQAVPSQGMPTGQPTMPVGGMQAPQGGNMPSATTQAPTGTGLPVGDPEAQIILKSLSSRLTQLGKMGR